VLSVLLTAFSFVMIIAIGAVLNKNGLLNKEAGSAVKKIMINLTLPCAIIVNFSRIAEISGSMVILVILGFVSNVLMTAAGVIVTAKKSRADKALYILGLPGYSIGAFCLPFVQGFLPDGVVSACLFDAGNSIMCTGGTYAFASEYLSGEHGRTDIRAFIKRIVSSPPLVTYAAMFILVSVLHLRLPDFILTLISPEAASNTFLSMLMIGLLMKIEFSRDYLKDTVRLLAIRHIFAVITALLFWYMLPFDELVRKTLVMVSFGPLSIISTAYTGMCGGDDGKAGAINSISIILSIIELTIIAVVI